MKTIALIRAFNYYTKLNVTYHEIIRLANQGLLGNIENHQDSKHRNFNTENCERVFIILFAQKCLGNKWNTEQWLDFFNGKNREELIKEFLTQNDKIEKTASPHFRELLYNLSNK